MKLVRVWEVRWAKGSHGLHAKTKGLITRECAQSVWDAEAGCWTMAKVRWSVLNRATLVAEIRGQMKMIYAFTVWDDDGRRYGNDWFKTTPDTIVPVEKETD
jgi:hypothetical protein